MNLPQICRMKVKKIAPILGLIVLILGAPAYAVQLDRDGCLEFAIWGRDLIWARDVGADRAKVKAYLDENKEATPLFKALLPLFDQIWETKIDKTVLMKGLYEACIARRGNFGTET